MNIRFFSKSLTTSASIREIKHNVFPIKVSNSFKFQQTFNSINKLLTIEWLLEEKQIC